MALIGLRSDRADSTACLPIAAIHAIARRIPCGHVDDYGKSCKGSISSELMSQILRGRRSQRGTRPVEAFSAAKSGRGTGGGRGAARGAAFSAWRLTAEEAAVERWAGSVRHGKGSSLCEPPRSSLTIDSFLSIHQVEMEIPACPRRSMRRSFSAVAIILAAASQDANFFSFQISTHTHVRSQRPKFLNLFHAATHAAVPTGRPGCLPIRLESHFQPLLGGSC